MCFITYSGLATIYCYCAAHHFAAQSCGNLNAYTKDDVDFIPGFQ